MSMGFLKLTKKICIRSVITQWRWHNEFVMDIMVLPPLLHSAPALISLPLSRHSTAPQHEISLKFNVPFPDFENHIRFGWHFASHNLNPNTSMEEKKRKKKINHSVFAYQICTTSQCSMAEPGPAQVTLLTYPTEPPEHGRHRSAFLTDQYPQILARAFLVFIDSR